jgi:flavin reductase (DIM6/NTAB) family NADH-FMN oxidoreductase RutF
MSFDVFRLVNHEIFILSTVSGGRDYGCVITWVTSASLATGKSRVVVALSRENATTEAILIEKRFCLQLLHEKQFDLVPRFGLYSSRDKDKYKGLNVIRTKQGHAIINGVCGWAAYDVASFMDYGDRIVTVGNGVDGAVLNQGPTLLKQTAFEKVPAADREALEAKYTHDGARAVELFKNKPTQI